MLQDINTWLMYAAILSAGALFTTALLMCLLLLRFDKYNKVLTTLSVATGIQAGLFLALLFAVAITT